MDTTGNKASSENGGRKEKEPPKAAPYTRYYYLGWQFVFSFLLYAGLGYALDTWLDTLPLFLIIGIIVGMVAIFVLLFRVVKDMNPDD